MFEALHGVDHKKKYSSKLAGTALYKTLLGEVLALRHCQKKRNGLDSSNRLLCSSSGETTPVETTPVLLGANTSPKRVLIQVFMQVYYYSFSYVGISLLNNLPFPPNICTSMTSRRYVANVLHCGKSPTRKMSGKHNTNTATIPKQENRLLDIFLLTIYP